MAVISSEKGAVTETLNISDINVNFPRHTVAIRYFSDAGYNNEVTTGLSGSIAIEGIASGGGTYTAFNNSPINPATAGSIASAASPITDIRVTPTTVAGATHYEVTVTSNRS